MKGDKTKFYKLILFGWEFNWSATLMKIIY